MDKAAYEFCRSCRFCSSHLEENTNYDTATCEYMAHNSQSRVSVCKMLGVSSKVGEGCPCFAPYEAGTPENVNWRKQIVLAPPSWVGDKKPRTGAGKRPQQNGHPSKIDEDKARRLWADGKTDREIAEAVGVTVGAIWQWRTRRYLAANYQKKPPKKGAVSSGNGAKAPRFDRAEALRLYREGMSDYAIGRRLGVSANGIFKWRKRNGLSANNKRVEHAKRGEEQNVGAG